MPARRRRPARRERWRAWRRSRPFWGGLLLILSGLELFAIPLSGDLIHGAIKLVIYIGIAGVFGVLIGALLVAAGLVIWFNQAHKTFYGIAGIVLGIVSFPASNLGGLFVGMLLAIIGGSIAFAWTPIQPAPDPVAGHGCLVRRGRGGAVVRRLAALAAAPLLLAAGLMAFGGGHASAAAQAAQPTPSQTLHPDRLLHPVFRQPDPDPEFAVDGAGRRAAPSASAAPSATGARRAPAPTGATARRVPFGRRHAVRGQPVPHGEPVSVPSPSPSPTQPKNATAAAGLVVSNVTWTMTVGSATMNGFVYKGNVNLPLAGGGTIQMMEFTVDSMTMSNAVTQISENGQTGTETDASFSASGVTLYATQLTGDIYGVPAPLTFTPHDGAHPGAQAHGPGHRDGAAHHDDQPHRGPDGHPRRTGAEDDGGGNRLGLPPARRAALVEGDEQGAEQVGEHLHAARGRGGRAARARARAGR